MREVPLYLASVEHVDKVESEVWPVSRAIDWSETHVGQARTELEGPENTGPSRA